MFQVWLSFVVNLSNFFPGTACRFFLKLLVTITVAIIIIIICLRRLPWSCEVWLVCTRISSGTTAV